MFDRLKSFKDSLSRTRNQAFGQIKQVLGQSDITEHYPGAPTTSPKRKRGVCTAANMCGCYSFELPVSASFFRGVVHR